MRKWTCLLLVVLLVFTAGGCSPFRREAQEMPPPNGDRLPLPDKSMRETVLYLPDESRQLLVPVRTYIPWEEGIARATLGYLVEGAVPQELLALGLKPLLPAGTTVLGLSVRDGLARVDLSEDVLRYLPEHTRMVVYGLVYTLTEFPTINKVEILVAGNRPDLPGIIPLNEPLDRSAGMNLEVAGELEDFADTMRITLYFLYPAADAAYFVPVTRVVPKSDDLLMTVAEELLRGPAPGSLLFSAIPQAAVVESVDVVGSKVVLNVSEGFSAISGGQRAADRLRQQIALTFTEISGVTDVEVRANNTTPHFPVGVSFPPVFGRPGQWNLPDGAQ